MERRINVSFKRLGFGDILEEDEFVEKSFRKIFFPTLVRLIFWGGILGVLGWGMYLFEGEAFWTLFIVSLYALSRFIFFFYRWYFNAILMTTNNLIFTEWEKFFHKKSTRIDYWNLDEIQVQRVGLRSFLQNFGDLYFMKFNGGMLYEFKKASRPHYVARIIEAYREGQVDAKNFTEESALKNLIFGMVQSHVREHGDPERQSDKKKEKTEIVSTAKEVSKPQSHKVPQASQTNLEIEKELDDEGGIDIDLEERD